MSQLVIAPLLVPLTVGILLLLGRRSLSWAGARALSLASVWAQLLLAIELWRMVGDGAILVYPLGNWPPPWGIVLVADRLAVWMLALTALLALFALLYAFQGTDRQGRHFHALYQWQLFGLNGAFLTGDLFNLFVFFEVLLLASYALLVHGGGPERVRAGLQFTAINLLGSTLFLLAAGACYGIAGTLNLADLAQRLSQLSPDLLGPMRTTALLLFAVFALKSALAPLHLWLPSAYAAAPGAVAALFAIMTKVGAYALLRIQTLLFGMEAGPLKGLYAEWLWGLGLATALFGALGALAADRLRLQVAYLAISSIGLILTAFGQETRVGIAAGLYYLTHSTLAIGAFFLLADRIASGRGELEDRLAPGPALGPRGRIGLMFLLCALLAVGLPPLSGFIGKLAILQAAFATADWPWVLGLLLTSSLLILIALMRSGTLVLMNVQPPGHPPQPVPNKGSGGDWPILGLIALCLGLTLAAASILRLAESVAEQLSNPEDYVRAVLQGAMP